MQANFFATKRSAVPFDEIASFQMASAYDQDGYAVTQAEMVMRSGERIPLPATVEGGHIRALNMALGRR